MLNRMGRALEVHGSGDFRNPNGVYMKMMNFRRFDPAYTGRGHVGLTRGNKDEEVVWNEFARDRPRLAKVAAAIRAAVEQDAAELAELSIDDEGMEAPEGRVLTRLHRVRERNQKLVEQRKTKALREKGALTCEVCEFDYEKCYGKRGYGFIEAYHTRALASLPGNGMTKLEDLALVCANCHRMIHAQKPWLSVEELRAILR